MAHNRQKERLIAPDSPWLRRLKLADEGGEIIPRMMDKYRQINKFAEILAALVEESFPETLGSKDGPREALQGLDMGSGKGYLTFAAHDWLSQRFDTTTRGIEYRTDLVDLCNGASREAGFFPGLSFQAGSIAAPPIDRPNPKGDRALLVIALHACDTATDDALLRAINEGARIIIASPCCHKQVRGAFSPAEDIRAVTRFGILEERLAELLTDAIRALILEAAGYKVKVFEFIDREHTGKNLMISAVRSSDSQLDGDSSTARKRAKLAEARDLCSRFGVKRQALLDALG